MTRFCIKTVVVSLLFFAFLSNTYASDTFDIYVARGIEKINEKQFSEALEHLKKALEMAPEDTEALYYTALVYTRLGTISGYTQQLCSLALICSYTGKPLRALIKNAGSTTEGLNIVNYCRVAQKSFLYRERRTCFRFPP